MWNIIENAIKAYLILQCLLYKSSHRCPHTRVWDHFTRGKYQIQINPIMGGKWCKNNIMPGVHGLKKTKLYLYFHVLSFSSNPQHCIKCILKSAQHSGSELLGDLISSSYQIKGPSPFYRADFLPCGSSSPEEFRPRFGSDNNLFLSLILKRRSSTFHLAWKADTPPNFPMGLVTNQMQMINSVTCATLQWLKSFAVSSWNLTQSKRAEQEWMIKQRTVLL